MSTPTFVGYFAKRRSPSPDWLGAEAVAEICSVSECIASGSEDWVTAWRHNDWGFFDTPDLAWSVVPAAVRPDFDLFGYELFPWRFEAGRERELRIAAPAAVPLGADFDPLGFDVVSRTADSFECSPLSCNAWAREAGANAFCLVDDVEKAKELASVAEAEGYEPGDYYVFRVWRRRGP